MFPLNGTNFFNSTNVSTFNAHNYRSNATSGDSISVQAQTITVTIGRIVLDLIGLVGNSLLLLACYRQQRAQPSSVGILIIQLVLSWWFYCALFVPIGEIVRLFNFFGLNLNQAYCDVMMTFSQFLSRFSNWMEACLAANRLGAICWPTFYPRMASRTVTWFMSFVTVGVAFISSLLPVGRQGGRYGLVGINQCGFMSSSKWGTNLGLLMFFVPNGLVFLCYVVVFIKAKYIYVAHRERLERETDSGRRLTEAELRKMQTFARRINAATMLLWAFVCAMICDIPYLTTVFGLAYMYARYPTLAVWTTLLFRVQYSLCPYIMIGGSNDYKATVRSYLARIRRTLRAKTVHTR